MASYIITAPDGRKFRVSGEGTKEEALAQFQASYTQSSAQQPQQPQERHDPSEGGGTLSFGPIDTGIKTPQWLDRGLAGAGKAFVDAGRGIGQMGAGVADFVNPREPTLSGLVTGQQPMSRVDEMRASVQDSRERDAALMNTGMGKVGNLAGNLSMALPTMAIPGANTVAGSGLVGAAMGTIQPSTSTTETLTNVGLGGALGAGGQYAGQKIAKAVGDKLLAREATAHTAEAANSVRDATLREALDAGLVVPPATSNPNALNTAAESVSGKAATQSAASAKNQPTINSLIRQELGIAANAPLTRKTLKEVRTSAGKAYEAVKETGDIVPDQQFLDEVVGLVSGPQDVAKAFPGAKAPAGQHIEELADSLMQPKFTANAAVEYVKRLRSSAKANFKAANIAGDPEKLAMGHAEWDAAGTLEDMIGRHLQGIGKGDLAEQFDKARVLIAKSHSAEAALNEGTGNIIARNLTTQLKRNKPLSGAFDLIARFGQAFPKAVAEPTQSGGVSALSAAIGGGGAVMGHPELLAIPLARWGTRKAILTKAMQPKMAMPSYAPGKTGNALLKSMGGLGRIASPLALSAQAVQQ